MMYILAYYLQVGPWSCPMNGPALLAAAREGGFWSYVAGVAYTVSTQFDVGGIHIDNYSTTLPMGKGLSSSAAVCVLVARAFSKLYELKMLHRSFCPSSFLLPCDNRPSKSIVRIRRRHTHARTHTNTQAHKRAHTHTRTQTQTQTQAHAHTHEHKHTRAHAHIYTHLETFPYPVIHTCAFKYTHIRTNMHGHIC